MDFTLSKQQQMVQKMYREFAENEVKPLAKKVDAEEYFPKETVEKMGKLGMMGIYFPTEVGGAGGDVLSYVMAVEELSKVCGTTGVIVSAHTSLCAAPIYENGTPEQKAKYLPKLCSGEWLGVFVDEALDFLDSHGLPLEAVAVSCGPGSFLPLAAVDFRLKQNPD